MEYMNQNGKEISMIITYMGVKYRLFSALFIVDCIKNIDGTSHGTISV